MTMHKSLRLISALLFPACGLCLLLGSQSLSPQLLLPSGDMAGMHQRKPAWANPNRRVILRCQYRHYLRSRHHRTLGIQAAAYYNQCVEDSDPSALTGTGLPHGLP